MSLTPCDWCRSDEFLSSYYGDILNEYALYLGEPRDMPKLSKDPNKDVIGYIDRPSKKIVLRNDLAGKYDIVPFSKLLNYNGMDFLVKGILKVPWDVFTAAHECSHGKYPYEKSESEIDKRALDDYIEFYAQKFLKSVMIGNVMGVDSTSEYAKQINPGRHALGHTFD